MCIYVFCIGSLIPQSKEKMYDTTAYSEVLCKLPHYHKFLLDTIDEVADHIASILTQALRRIWHHM